MIPLAVDRPFLLPLVPFRVPAGFPSPALDFDCKTIDLHALLIGNAPATFLWRLSGWSMRDLGLGDGDLLMVDRSLRPQHGDIVVIRRPYHVGVWLDIDGGGVLHAIHGACVIWTPDASWRTSGFGRREYLRHRSRA